MHLPIPLSEIAQSVESAATPDEVDRRLAQAAAAVEDFSSATALSALETALAGAAAQEPRTLDALRSLAEETTQQAEVLSAETARFLDHFDESRKN